MDWNQRNVSSSAHVNLENQQYFAPTVTAASHSISTQPLSLPQSSFSRSRIKEPILQGLLNASSSAEYVKLQQAALLKASNKSKSILPKNQGLGVQSNPSYSSVANVSTLTCKSNTSNGSVLMSHFRIKNVPNSVQRAAVQSQCAPPPYDSNCNANQPMTQTYRGNENYARTQSQPVQNNSFVASGQSLRPVHSSQWSSKQTAPQSVSNPNNGEPHQPQWATPTHPSQAAKNPTNPLGQQTNVMQNYQTASYSGSVERENSLLHSFINNNASLQTHQGYNPAAQNPTMNVQTDQQYPNQSIHYPIQNFQNPVQQPTVVPPQQISNNASHTQNLENDIRLDFNSKDTLYVVLLLVKCAKEFLARAAWESLRKRNVPFATILTNGTIDLHTYMKGLVQELQCSNEQPLPEKTEILMQQLLSLLVIRMRQMARGNTDIERSQQAPHSSNPGASHIPHGGSPVSSHDAQGINPGSAHNPQRTNPVSAYNFQGVNPVSVNNLQRTKPVSVHNPQGANPVTNINPQGANPVTCHNPQGANPVTCHNPQGANPVTCHNPQGANPVTCHNPQGANPVTCHNPQGANTVTCHNPQGANPVFGYNQQGANIMSGNMQGMNSIYRNIPQSNSLSRDERNQLVVNGYTVFNGEQVNSENNVLVVAQTKNSDVNQGNYSPDRISKVPSEHLRLSNMESLHHTNSNISPSFSGGLFQNADLFGSGQYNGTNQQDGSGNTLQANGQVSNANEKPATVSNSILNTAGINIKRPSLEALETCLSLWKGTSQNVSSGGMESEGIPVPTEEPYQSEADIDKVETSAAVSDNTSEMKQDTLPSNVSKGTEPRVAFVLPLVQRKVPKESVVESSAPDNKEKLMCYLTNIDSLTMTNDKEFLDKLKALNDLKCMKSGFQDLETGITKEILPPLKSDPDTLTSDSPQNNEPCIETLIGSLEQTCDNQESSDSSDLLQISAVCSLAEGNLFYDSSIAQIFDKDPSMSVDQPLSHVKVECMQPTEEDNLFPPPFNEKESMDLQTQNKSDIPELNANYNQELEPVQPKTEIGSCSETHEQELHSAGETDQLGELLTEFPFGIKNYISKQKNTLVFSLEEKGTVSKVEDGKNLAENLSVCIGVKTEKETIPDTPVYSVSLPVKLEDNEAEPMPCSQARLLRMTETELPPTLDDETKPVSTNLKFEKMPCLVRQETTLSENMSVPISPTNTGSEILPVSVNQAKPVLEGSTVTVKQERAVSSPAKQNLDLDRVLKTLKDEPVETDIVPAIIVEESLNHCKNISKQINCKDNPVFDHTEKASISESTKMQQTHSSAETMSRYLQSEESSERRRGSLCESPEDAKVTEEKQAPKKFCCLFSWLNFSYGNAPMQCSCNKTDVKTIEMSSKDIVQGKDGDLSDHKEDPSNSCKMAEAVKRPSAKDTMLKDKAKVRQSDNRVGSACQDIKKSKSNDLKNVTSQNDKKEKKIPQEIIIKRSSSLDLPIDKSNKLIVKTDFLKNRPSQKVREKKYGVEESASSMEKVRSPEKTNESRRMKSTEKPCKRPRSSSDGELLGGIQKRLREISPSHKEKGEKQVSTKERRVLTVEQYWQRQKYRETSSSTPDLPASQKNSHRIEKRPNVENPKTGSLGHGSRSKNLKTKSPAKSKYHSSRAKDHHRTDRHLNIERAESSKPRWSENAKQKDNYRNVKKHSSENLKSHSGKEKIYLTPCVEAESPTFESMGLTKLEVRPSGDPRRHFKSRQRSLDSNVGTRSFLNTSKNSSETPKMLEFKLCPELLPKSPQGNRLEEFKSVKEKSTVEGIKSKKEAWLKDIPLKKRKLESTRSEGRTTLTVASRHPATDKESSRPSQDSKSAFQTFQKMYFEKSKQKS
ncbi:hypothetical protein GDO86_005008 [Hymenochirus boettgeri]|uniref:Uncharacterized protein n=1 Tax=Hymenochirus boettgeri TaxID=247094 RepID=A0A8T2J4F7_9PIPI|nr:hypothetical protein GDO86_005008 [Hymenochirus boettgeri]